MGGEKFDALRLALPGRPAARPATSLREIRERQRRLEENTSFAGQWQHRISGEGDGKWANQQAIRNHRQKRDKANKRAKASRQRNR